METRDKFVMSVAFSPDSKWLASGGLDGLVNIFDVKVGSGFVAHRHDTISCWWYDTLAVGSAAMYEC